MSGARVRGPLCAAVCLLFAAPALAQQPAPPAAAAVMELYQVHVVKAAAGKLSELIDVYLNGPAPAPGDPQVDPLVLRHREGGEWDLVVITPLGRDHTLNTDALPQPVQELNQRVGVITDWHADTFAVGPAWSAVQQALLPARSAQQAVYVVSDYRSLPGHRQQLRQTLDRIAQPDAGRTALFVHVEGAPWNFLTVTRYDSWTALGDQTQPGPAGGQADPGLELRQHMAVHHDTVAVYAGGGEARK